MKTRSRSKRHNPRCLTEAAALRRSCISLAVAAALLGSASPRSAWAEQDSGSGAAKEEDKSPVGAEAGNAATDRAAEQVSLEEVRVVARRFLPDVQTTATGLEMRLIETPQSISVITPEMLQVANARTIYDAADMIPGLTKSGKAVSVERLFLRGQRVEVYRVNGTDLDNFWDSPPDAYAVERVEVARGPATVLYGVTGAFGGEVNNILKSPESEYQLQLGVEGGDFDRTRYELDVTGTVPGTNDRLRARAAAAYSDWGTEVTRADVSNNDRFALVGFEYDLTPSTMAEFYYYQERRNLDSMDGCALQELPGGGLQIPTLRAEHWYCGDPKYSRFFLEKTYYIASVKHSFANDWNLKAQGIYSKYDSLYSAIFPFGPVGAYGLGDNEIYLYTYDTDKKGDDMAFDVSLGGGFESFGREHQFHAALEYQENPDPTQSQVLDSTFAGFMDIFDGGLGIQSDGSPIPTSDRNAIPVRVEQVTERKTLKASFQALINATDRLAFLGGFLYEDAEIFQQRVLPVTPAQTVKLDELIWRFGATYDLTDGSGILDDARLYFSYSEGFHPNIGEFGENGEPLTDPQEAESYEIGVKGEFLGGKLIGSIAVYTMEITNVPSGVFTLGGIGLGFDTLDSKREADGVEVELVGELRPGWNAVFAYAYQDNKISDPSFPDLDFSVRSIPEHSASFFTSYEFLGGALNGFRIGGAAIYKGDYTFVDNASRIVNFGQVTDSYTRFDLNVAYAGFEGSLSGLELWGHIENVSDADYFYDRNGTGAFSLEHGAPRTLTVGMRYKFR